jgi:hypothetical protein
MTLYDLLLFFHIICVILWLGTGTTLALIGLYGRRRSDPVVLERLEPLARWLGPRVFAPSALGVLAFGLALVGRGSWTLHPLWVKLGLASDATLLVTTFAVRAPLLRRLGSADADRQRFGPVLGALAWFELTVLYLTVADMVTKPNGSDTVALATGAGVLAAAALAAITTAMRWLRTSEVMR